MLLKQIAKNNIFNQASQIIVNPVKRSLITSIKNFKPTKNTTNIILNFNQSISSKRFFSSNKEENKESRKEEEIKKEEEEIKKQQETKTEEGNKELNEKYKELKTLFNEQEQKLDQARKKFHEMKDLYLKGIEEIDAIKLRNEREIKNTKEYAISKFAKDLLDVHDNFTRALDVISEKDFKSISSEEKDETFATFVEGIEMTQKGLLNTLKKHGIVLYDPKNEKFDPNKHEAVFDYEDENLNPGTIGQVMQTGFSIGERVLRPAKVGVVKKSK